MVTDNAIRLAVGIVQGDSLGTIGILLALGVVFMYVRLRPSASELDAQKMRPPMLNKLSSPTNPAAAATVTPNIS